MRNQGPERDGNLSRVGGFPAGSVNKVSACNAGDLGSIFGSERSPREGNGNPLQYSCQRNPMDRGAWRATIHGVAIVGHDLATKPPPSGLSTHPWDEFRELESRLWDIWVLFLAHLADFLCMLPAFLTIPAQTFIISLKFIFIYTKK